MVDAAAYHAKAVGILQSGWLAEVSSYQAPLYPYIIAAIYSVFGVDPFYVQIFQCVFSVANVFLIFLIARRLFGPRVGIAAAAIACLYGPFIFFAGILLKESLAVFFADAMLLVLLSAAARPRAWKYLAAGALFGIAAMLRENFYLVLPAIILWILWHVPSFRRKAVFSLAMIAGVAALLAPFAIKNARYSKGFSPAGYHAGLNFFIGNNPDATGVFERFDFFRPGPEFEESDVRVETERMLRRKLSPQEVSRYWLEKTVEGFRDSPLIFPKLLAVKAALFLGGREYPDNYDFNFVRSLTYVLKTAFAGYGLVMVFALFGIFLSRSRAPAFGLMYVYAAAFALSVIVFYINARYRFPIAPVLIVFAAYAIAEGWKKILAGGPVKIALAAAIAAGLFLSVTDAFRDKTEDFAISWFGIGNTFENQGRLDEATLYYEKALALLPDYSNALHQTGSVLEKQGRVDDAIEKYLEAIEVEPCFLDAHFSLASAYEKMGLVESAASAWNAVFDCRPNQPDALNNLALLHERTGRTENAVDELKKAIDERPYDANLHNNLGVIFLARGLYEPAEERFAEALKIDPGHAAAIENMNSLNASKGAAGGTNR